MLYWVTGHQRSGTSMMMGCLVMGGMEALYDPDNYSFGQLLYEIKDIKERPEGDGVLVKLLGPAIMGAVRKGDRVIMMRREYDEVAASYAKEGGRFKMSRDRFQRRYDGVTRVLRGRDIEVLTFRYPDVVADPGKVFMEIHKAGWPVNPMLACQYVDPELYRNRA